MVLKQYLFSLLVRSSTNKERVIDLTSKKEDVDITQRSSEDFSRAKQIRTAKRDGKHQSTKDRVPIS